MTRSRRWASRVTKRSTSSASRTACTRARRCRSSSAARTGPPKRSKCCCASTRRSRSTTTSTAASCPSCCGRFSGKPDLRFAQPRRQRSSRAVENCGVHRRRVLLGGGPRTGLPFQAHPLGRVLRAGRQLLDGRARLLRRDEQGPRPAVRGREQAGRRRQHRRQRGSRRLDPEGIRRLHRQGAGALEGSRAESSRQDRMTKDWDVIVIGGGNAALCAALSAKEAAKRVLLLERAPEDEAGGNSRFTAGLIRIVYNGAGDLAQLIDLSKEEIERTDFGTYTAGQFLDDMARVTEYRCDPDLTEILVKQSFPAALWMKKKGLRFTAAWGRQAFKIDGRFKFWGGLTLEAIGGGPGLVESLTQIAKKNGVEVWYQARPVSLIPDDAGVHRVVAKKAGKTTEGRAKAVVLAAGGFQANPEWRTRYLGPLWELAKVRGTRFNTGDAIRMALDIGAAPVGNWSGCHAVAWE